MFPTILKNIDVIETNKNQIFDMWFEHDVVKFILIGNKIKINFFKDVFAKKILNNLINIVKSKSSLGKCPSTYAMIMLFKSKRIALADIYIIHANLKASILLFLHKNSLLDADMLKEISMLIDYNIDGIIREYVETNYYDINQVASSTNVTTYNKHTNNKDQEVLSAPDYLENIDFNLEIITELTDLEYNTITTIESQNFITQETILKSSTLFEKYSIILNNISEFNELKDNVVMLTEILNKTDIHSINDEAKYLIKKYLKATIYDLTTWRLSIFVKKDAKNIHYLDKEIIENIIQLGITLVPEETFKTKD